MLDYIWYNYAAVAKSCTYIMQLFATAAWCDNELDHAAFWTDVLVGTDQECFHKKCVPSVHHCLVSEITWAGTTEFYSFWIFY